MQTLIELPDMEDCVKLCSEISLQFIELNMCLPQFQVETIDIDKLLKLSKKYNIFYTIHLNDTNTPCDFNPKIAKRLDIPVLNMHLSLGTHFTLPNKKVLLFEEYKDAYFKNLTLFRDKCERAIGNSKIKICIENTRAFCHSIGKKSLSLLLESPVFGVTFDTGHDASNTFSQKPIINKHISKLTHMHLHDALVNEHRDHLPFGDGELNIKEYLGLAHKHNCRVVIEVKTIEGLRKSVEWINHA